MPREGASRESVRKEIAWECDDGDGGDWERARKREERERPAGPAPIIRTSRFVLGEMVLRLSGGAVLSPGLVDCCVSGSGT